MNTFKYRIYYEYLGPSKEDPFALKPLSSDKVRHYLGSLCAILPDRFETTLKDDSVYVTARTSDSEEGTSAMLERYVVNLNCATSGLSLRVDKLIESSK